MLHRKRTPLVILFATFSMSGAQRHYLTFLLDSLPFLLNLPDMCGRLVLLTLVATQGWGSTGDDSACQTNSS